MEIQMAERCLKTLLRVFADYQVITANDESDADYMLREWKEEYQQWGLSMNVEKKEYSKIGDEIKDPDLQIYEIKRCVRISHM